MNLSMKDIWIIFYKINDHFSRWNNDACRNAAPEKDVVFIELSNQKNKMKVQSQQERIQQNLNEYQSETHPIVMYLRGTICV